MNPRVIGLKVLIDGQHKGHIVKTTTDVNGISHFDILLHDGTLMTDVPRHDMRNGNKLRVETKNA